MTTENTRNAAAELAQRIKSGRMDPSKIDEAGRPPSDRPPAYAEALMSEPTAPMETAAKLTDIDWDVIELALAHYAACQSEP